MINTILELYFSNFKCVRRYLGGVWVSNEENPNFWVSFSDDIYAFECIEVVDGFLTEDYRK